MEVVKTSLNAYHAHWLCAYEETYALENRTVPTLPFQRFILLALLCPTPLAVRFFISAPPFYCVNCTFYTK
jgi:hypothetical protein